MAAQMARMQTGADMENNCVLTFDVGGSHISSAVCRGTDYQLGPVASAHHDSVATSEDFVDLLFRLGAEAEAAAGCRKPVGAALAVPGPFDFEAGVSRMRHKLPYLYGFDLREALAARLACRPGQVLFLNDAAAYLLGEVGAGAARGFSRAIGFTLGTGIGSAFAVNGKIVTSGPAVPPGGEIWNQPYEGGIAEDHISTRAIIASYRQSTGQTCEVSEIAALAAHDPAAVDAFAEFGRHLGRLLLTLLSGFHPDVVVLGGGISRSSELFLPATRSQLENASVELRISELMDRAPLAGCAVAWFDSIGNHTTPASNSGNVA